MTETAVQPPPETVTVTYNPGTFIWREYGATNPEAAEKFYCELFGWSVQHIPFDGMTYRMFSAGGESVAGMFQIDPAMIPSSYWVGSLSVLDVDAATEAAVQAGATVLTGPMDVPGMGRYTGLLDPQGAAVSLWKSAQGDGPADAMPGRGEFCWDSLMTSDLEGAKAFYNRLVGWTAATTEWDENSAVFNLGDVMKASVTKAEDGVPSHWCPHVAVYDLAEAVDKAKALGATILTECAEIPYGSFAIIQDPFGGVISFFQGKEMDC